MYVAKPINVILDCIFNLQGAQLRQLIDATLGSGNLREAVRLPPGEDLNEWLAVNSNSFLSFYSLSFLSYTMSNKPLALLLS